MIQRSGQASVASLPSAPIMGARSRFTGCALNHQFDQGQQTCCQADQARHAAGALGTGTFARQKPEQRDRPDTPKRSVLDAQAFLPVARHPAHFLQGL